MILKYNYLFSQKYNVISNLIKVFKRLYNYKFNYKKVIDKTSITSNFAERVLKIVIKEIES